MDQGGQASRHARAEWPPHAAGSRYLIGVRVPAGMPRPAREAGLMKRRGRWRERWASLVGLLGHNRLGLVGLAMLGLAIGVAVFAPWIAPYDPEATIRVTIEDIYAKPSAAHLLGTDDGGKDVFSAFALRRPRLAGRRLLRVADLDAHRRKHWPDRRLLRRAAGQPAHAPDRHLPGDPRPAAHDRHRGDGRPQPVEHHHRHRDPGLDGDGAHRALAGVEPEGTPVRAARPGDRRRQLPHPAAAHLPARAASDGHEHRPGDLALDPRTNRR